MLFLLAACHPTSGDNPDGQTGDGHGSGDGHMIDMPGTTAARTIFVIPLENKSSSQIYASSDAPYINGLMVNNAWATNFQDELPSQNSEPHYVWMEAGTNVFSDASFTSDSNPSSSNSTASTDHFVNQLEAKGIPWMSYQEDAQDGKCPISGSGQYAPKHDPFVFFKDVAGSPPSATTPRCIQHHKPYSKFAADLAAGMSGYVFITPNLCHDMHGDIACFGQNDVKVGDTWLSNELPRIIQYAQAHDALIFLTWDEGDTTNLMPMVVIGNHVKTGSVATMYTHSSMLKSMEEYFGVPVLSTVTSANDFADMFQPGTFP